VEPHPTKLIDFRLGWKW